MVVVVRTSAIAAAFVISRSDGAPDLPRPSFQKPTAKESRASWTREIGGHVRREGGWCHWDEFLATSSAPGRVTIERLFG